MKQPRTSSLKTYVIVYQDAYGNGILKHTNMYGRNAQEAVEAFRKMTDEKIPVITVARVVCDWK